MTQCHMRHPMLPSPMDMQPQACFICRAKFMPNCQTLTCPKCQVSLCQACVLTYTPETAFPMHLVCYAEESTLRTYRTSKACATTLYRDPYMATVFYEFQRFYNTDRYIALLEERVSNIENEIRCINSELTNTQNRLSSAKYELLCARQRKRKSSAMEENGQHRIKEWCE